MLTWAVPAAACIAALNILAYQQARSMTELLPGVPKPKRVDEISLIQKLKVFLTGVRLARPENLETPSDYGFDYRAIETQTRDGNSIECWALEHPTAVGSVVLVHGYSESKSAMLPEAQVLYRMGYSCLLVDLRGSGGSSGNVTTIGFYEAEDIAAAYRVAQSEFAAGPTIMYGRSMGGVSILRAISRKWVDPHAVVLEAPFDSLLSAVANRCNAMGVPGFPLANLMLFWGGCLRKFWAFSHRADLYAQSVDQPALVFQGTHDRRVTPAQARRVVANLSNGRMALVDQAKHESFLAKAPVFWRTEIEQFFHSIRTHESPDVLLNRAS